jgi:ATP-binding cassette subfamily C protein CydCD
VRPLDPRLLRHASAARTFVALTAALAVATAGLVLVQAELLASGIDRAFLGGAGLDELTPLLIGLLAVVAGRAGLTWAGEVAAHRASADVIRQLRSRLVAHALRLGPRHRGLPPTGELATLATRGLDGLDGYDLQPGVLMETHGGSLRSSARRSRLYADAEVKAGPVSPLRSAG